MFNISESAQTSDYMMCNDTMQFLKQQQEKSDALFNTIINNCVLYRNKDINKESNIRFQDNKLECMVLLDKSRVGNAKTYINCDKSIYLSGYDKYSNANMNDLLLIPCSKNTYKNDLVCDIAKCCSRSHQLFWNNTTFR